MNKQADRIALSLLIDSLELFEEAQTMFSDDGWETICEHLTGDNPVDCTWNQITDFKERLQDLQSSVA
jgi:hypothetical protein